ncbi:unnamed protein product, partial [Rotaria magnacalcarata]
RLDDGISLTTITSNFPVKIKNAQHDVSVCSDTAVSQSDTEENSEAIRPADQNLNNTYDINMVIDTQICLENKAQKRISSSPFTQSTDELFLIRLSKDEYNCENNTANNILNLFN